MGRSRLVEFHRDERVERRRRRRRQVRRRRLSALVLLGAIAAAIAASTTDLFGDKKSAVVAVQEKPIEIRPGLGTRILPDYRVVASFGAPNGGARLGVLGVGTPTQAADHLVRDIVPPYRGGKPVLPALELIAVIAHREPQESGTYSTKYPDEQIQAFLDAARNHGAILILDIQPGQSPWMDEVRRLEPWLMEPDVSLAMDPEWSMKPGQVPGTVIGETSAAEINEVSAYLQQLINRHKLPQKLLVVHQFKDYQLKDQSQVVDRRNVKVVLNVDGFGTKEQKEATYSAITRPSRGKAFPMGFKLFFQEDNDPELGATIMSPYEVMQLSPQPDVIVYE